MAKQTPIEVDKDQQVLNRISRIEHRVDSIDQTQAFALRADAKKHFATVEQIFGKSKRRAQVYLAANGTRGVEEIGAHLNMKRQNVGTELKALREEGMLEITDTAGGRDIWGKKPIDHTLRISPFLRIKFALAVDGRDEPADKKKKRPKERK